MINNNDAHHLKHSNGLHLIPVIITGIIFTALMSNLWANFALGVPVSKLLIQGLITLALLTVLTMSLIQIANDPPHVGVITFLGKRIWRKDAQGHDALVIAEEGYNLIFLRGILFSVIPVNMKKQEIDFPEITVTTPDKATTKIRGSFAYDISRDYLQNFLNLGEVDGHGDSQTPWDVVQAMLDDIWEDELRAWARADQWPKTWEQLQDSSDAAVKLLVEKITAEQISDEDIHKARRGKGKWVIPQFGIVLTRVNLGQMETFGKVYEASLKESVEKRERKAEVFETNTDLNKAVQLQARYKKRGLDISIDNAYKLIMEYKVRREANEKVSLSAIFDQFFISQKNVK